MKKFKIALISFTLLLSSFATDLCSFTAAFILLGTITSASDAYKKNFKRKKYHIFFKYFQRCDGLFTQINRDISVN